MKKFFYILICFFFISGCFQNERKEVTECKLEIQRGEKIRNSFGYIETGLDINEIYTEDPESPRKVDCENVDTERVKNITEMMRKKNSYNANSPVLLERKALIEIEEFKKAHEEQFKDFKYFDNVLLSGYVEDYEILGKMLHIIYYDYVSKNRKFLWERTKNRIITQYEKWSGKKFENWNILFEEYKNFSSEKTKENKEKFCKIVEYAAPGINASYEDKIARFEISFRKEKFYFYLNDFDGRTNDDVINKICKN